MLSVVIDTNVIVSALLSPSGSPAKIIDMVAQQKLRVCYSPDILAELARVQPPHDKWPASPGLLPGNNDNSSVSLPSLNVFQKA